MSGIRREILAEIASNGKGSMSEVKKAFSNANQWAEKGRSTFNKNVPKAEDTDKYTGKNAK